MRILEIMSLDRSRQPRQFARRDSQNMGYTEFLYQRICLLDVIWELAGKNEWRLSAEPLHGSINISGNYSPAQKELVGYDGSGIYDLLQEASDVLLLYSLPRYVCRVCSGEFIPAFSEHIKLLQETIVWQNTRSTCKTKITLRSRLQ